jgi:4-hydroxy-2-oxoglutarate aldolase
MLLEGLQLPLTTPFYPDGRLNLRKLEHNVVRYSKTPVAGMVVLSDVGESTMLSDEESRLVLKTAIDAAAVEKVLLAGVSRDSVVATLDLAEHAASRGYDAVLIKSPSFLRGPLSIKQKKELLVFFQTVADRSALPIVLDEGSYQRGEIPNEIVIDLAGHPQMIGLVDQTGAARIAEVMAGAAAVKRDVTVTPVFSAVTRRMKVRYEAASGSEFIAADSLKVGGMTLTVEAPKVAAKTRIKTVGFQIVVGGTAGMLAGLRAGAVGAISPFAAAAPQVCYEVLAAWKDGDEGLAQEKQLRLQGVASRVEEELGVAGIKAGSDLNGYYGSRPRLPLLPLSGEEFAEIEELMRGLRN